MSVQANQIVAYGCAQMPEAEGVTVGGAVDFTKRVMFADLPYAGLGGPTNTDTLDLVGAAPTDTGVKVQVSGRDSTGVIVTPAVQQLNGTVVISNAFSAQAFQRLECGVITGGAIASLSNPGGTAATSDVAAMSHKRLISNHTCGGSSVNGNGVNPPLFSLQLGDGTAVAAAVYQGLGVIIRINSGPAAGQIRMIVVPYGGTASYGTDIVAINRDWGTVPGTASTYDLAYGFLWDFAPNPVSALTRMFISSASDTLGGLQRIYYDKCFLVNTNGTTSLTNATIQIASEVPGLPIGATLDLAVGSGANDTTTIVNRRTAPLNTGGFVVQPAIINAPGGVLANGNSAAVAVATWLRLTLNPGAAAYQGVADLQSNGNTT